MRTRTRVIVGVLAVAAVATSVTVSATTWTRSQEARERTTLEQQYLQVARQGVLDLTTISADTVDADVERVTSASTGRFRDEFSERAADFVSVVRDADVTATGAVSEAGIESMTDSEAQVLVAATSTVTNASGATDEPRVWRLRVSVARDGDRLALSDVQFVP
ncbi:hypothetical protein [Rhodococcus sp. MEB041]|uniref:hypothetical protein n=1 Tax=Rhodococcus sp. MEB041 TaxID=3040323 RepID=UPI002550CF69|nr:hypothetical protein [Rhodococcus sp. MEB041]